MKDLSLVFNPHELKVVDTNSEGLKIERIMFESLIPETSDELYTKAVKELIYRYSTDEIKERFFSETSIPGYLDTLTSAVKNSLSIIATILKEDKANNYFEVKVDHESEELKELSDDDKFLKGTCIDLLALSIVPSTIYRDKMIVVTYYEKVDKEGNNKISPITVEADIILNNIFDEHRNRILYSKGDNVYSVVSAVRLPDDPDEYEKKYELQFNEASEKALVHFANAVKRSKSDKNCTVCERAKNFEDKCFLDIEFDSVKDPSYIESILKKDIYLYGENGKYSFMLGENVINCLTPRVKKYTRLMVEHTLSLLDYMSNCEVEEKDSKEESEEK